MDKSGASFGKMVRLALRKGVGAERQKLLQMIIRTLVSLDSVNIMPVFSADVYVDKPVLIFSGKQPLYRRIRG